MELPIRVIVVLFVALSVGFMIILFAKQTINHAQDEINNLGSVKSPDQIIELDEVRIEDIISLAEACKKVNEGSADRVVCFALHGNSFPDWNKINDMPLDNGFTITVEDPGNQSAHTVMIVFDFPKIVITR